ncbi:MAG: hypothetical protein Unbinned8454contig1000_39 [Prokaryotic dsDNA virus sp.]|nr:MAG: hypothetical protein Unbinned8454contig1000_39 [Prokaryotic dsDNA virus sp.]|tara:strand:+ start:867 stop:1133 length:267 start_codon:yes stop_codon:yes gene_type:complete
MSLLGNISIDVKKIDKSKLYKGQYLNLDISVRDETNQYGQNVSLWYSRTKEERDNGVEKSYIGNGKVIWTDGKVTVAEKPNKEELVDF